jgi:hypothetical protein
VRWWCDGQSCMGGVVRGRCGVQGYFWDLWVLVNMVAEHLHYHHLWFKLMAALNHSWLQALQEEVRHRQSAVLRPVRAEEVEMKPHQRQKRLRYIPPALTPGHAGGCSEVCPWLVGHTCPLQCPLPRMRCIDASVQCSTTSRIQHLISGYHQ